MQAYYSYSVIIVAITFFSIITNVVSSYQYRRRLAALAHYTCQVQVRATGRQAGRQAGWAGSHQQVTIAQPRSKTGAAPECRRFPALRAGPQVLHNGRITSVDSTDLLPGDVVVLHPGILPCDLALIRCARRWLPTTGAAGAALYWARAAPTMLKLCEQ
jgi:magnesium-transporting ATPase (P-type)